MFRELTGAALAVAFSASLLAAQGPASLELVSSDGRTRTLSAAELAELTQSEVTVSEGRATNVFAGPALRDLLTLAGAPAGRSLRGPAMSLVVLAEAADGYMVAFTLSEIDPQFGNRTAIVASRLNGGPLSERDGPLQVVLPDDEFHARWVRQLVRLRLVQMPTTAAEAPHE